MKITVAQNDENLLELDSEGMSSEQMESSEKELRELLEDKEVLEWNLKFKEGMLADNLNSFSNIGNFVIEQKLTIK